MSAQNKMRRRRDGGAVTVEYVEILVICILGAAVALTPIGLDLMRYYDNMEFTTGLPFP